MVEAKLGVIGFGALPGVFGFLFWMIAIGLGYLIFRLLRKREWVFAGLNTRTPGVRVKLFSTDSNLI